jgi:hypothetical protein
MEDIQEHTHEGSGKMHSQNENLVNRGVSMQYHSKYQLRGRQHESRDLGQNTPKPINKQTITTIARQETRCGILRGTIENNMNSTWLHTSLQIQRYSGDTLTRKPR